jgi:hypothetical protein
MSYFNSETLMNRSLLVVFLNNLAENRDSPKLVEFVSLNLRPMYILWFLCLFNYKLLTLSTVNKWKCPNMLDRKPMFIRIPLFGFLSFLWLTCKVPSLVGSSWVLDSGCTNHMTGERSIFQSYSLKLDSNENIVMETILTGMCLVSVKLL